MKAMRVVLTLNPFLLLLGFHIDIPIVSGTKHCEYFLHNVPGGVSCKGE